MGVQRAGRGATFKIYLPRVDAPVDAPDLRDRPSRRWPVAVRRCCVAEDDPSVRAIVAEVLTQKGYRVLRAHDGQAALEMARAQSGAIHLLVTDIVMPGMTGRELAEALRVERPGLARALHVRLHGRRGRPPRRAGGRPALPPEAVLPAALASKVREVLDNAGMPAS